ncbi:uncharacterized protein LOC132059143 [Lycium ferocissimum]|uniref:uncharacterized protein LOC132059143 n=1 Tax=Lycium ferocissimum TaxID=112874 RepID=UPI002815BE8D|nr:uncharacterized protein LOC132059143 [Lycium ferocissimum]
MADTTTTTASDDQQNKPTNPIMSFICGVLQFFKPPPPNNNKIEETTSDPKPTVSVIKEEKPDVVKFPKQDLETSLKLESEGTETNTNPVVLWQVYAIGGFFVLRWAWSRWNERRGNKKPSDEEPPPGQE